MKQNDRMDSQLQMRGLLMGFVVSRALQVAAELGLADALADGPKQRAALAGGVGADPATLHRLLRACASLGVFEELADGRYANTPRSEFLRSDVAGSLSSGRASICASKASRIGAGRRAGASSMPSPRVPTPIS